MKSVGQQLQEARLAKNWTPELAARETKIKADRVRDLEADDYSHFSSPTYARGFVRTYARALGLDEYRILRQLDNKLPEDDNASFAPDNGMPYVPEPSVQATHVSSAPRTGLYIVLALGCAVIGIIAFVLFQAYRAGELPRYFASTGDNSINSGTAPVVDTEAPPHALPVDANDTSHSVRALPVDPNALAGGQGTNAAPAAAAVPSTNSPAATPPATPAPAPVAASPASPASVSTNTVVVASITPPAVTAAPVPALPPAEAPAAAAPAESAPSASPATPAVPVPAAAASAEEVNAPRALPVNPAELAADEAKSAAAASNGVPAAPPVAPPAVPIALPVTTTNAAGVPQVVTPVDLGGSATNASAAPADVHPVNKRLVLTASRDSFVEVTSLDSSAGKPVLFASVLRAGQSLSFDGRKFSVNVGIPSAVDIVLDGVYYGPHSDHQSPETFTLESHQP